jgi:hypothetical protein
MDVAFQKFFSTLFNILFVEYELKLAQAFA